MVVMNWCNLEVTSRVGYIDFHEMDIKRKNAVKYIHLFPQIKPDN